MSDHTIDGQRQRRALRARGRGAQAARPLHPRRPRPDRHARRLRHRATAAPAPSSSTASPVKSCMLLAPQADGAEITTVEGLAGDDGELTTAPAGVLRAPRPPVRLLHARDAAQRDLPALAHAEADATRRSAAAIQGNICRCTGYVNIVKSIKAAIRPMTETRRTEHPGRARGRLRRQEHPAQGGRPARPGPGRLRRRRQAARDGLRPLRPRAVRAREDRLGRRLRRRGARGRLRDADAGRGRRADRPVLRADHAARAARSRTTRSRSAASATSASRSSPSSPRPASSPATPPTSSRSSTSRST